MKVLDGRISFRNGRYFIRDTNIRIDLVVGLGVEEVLKNYPWLLRDQVADALDFVKDLLAQKGKYETKNQIQTI